MLSTMKFALLSSLIFSLLFLSACSNSSDQKTNTTPTEMVSIQDNSGDKKVPLEPKNLVILDASVLDTMTLFDAPIAGVPQTASHYPAFMSQYLSENYFNAGSFFEPDYERINQAQPQLIITGGRALAAAPELSKIAQTIDLGISFGQTLPALKQQVTSLGQITGHTEKANALLQSFDEKMAKVAAKGEKAGSALVIMLSGGRISAYGAGSRFGFIYDQLGFKPAVDLENKGKHGNPMSFELLLKTNPDWIFVFSRDEAIGSEGAQSAKQIMNNEIVQQSKAFTENQLVYLDASALYVAGGYNAYMQLMDEVEQALDLK